MKYVLILISTLTIAMVKAQNWTNIGELQTMKIHFHDPDTGFAFLDINDINMWGLCVTVNGGKTWKSVASYNDGKSFNERSIMFNSKIAFYTRGEQGAFEISLYQGRT